MLPFQVFITFLLVPIIIQAIRISSQNQTGQTYNRVHMPTAFFIIGMCGCLFSCITIVISIFVPFNSVVGVITASIAIVSILLLSGHFSCQIQYSDEYICVTKFFRVQKYTYMDIQGIELRGNGGYFLIMKGGKVHIDGFSVGKENFLEFVERKYAENHNSCFVPIMGNQLFNGYVIEPEPFIALMCLPCIGMLILSMVATWEFLSIEIPKNLTGASIVAERIQEDGNVIVIIEGNKEYRILADAVSNVGELYSAIPQYQTIVTECEFLAETTEKEVFGIWYLQVDNKILATYETVCEAKSSDGLHIAAMLWFGTILWVMLVGSSFYILSHAPQYPVIASLLVKKEYRNF